MLPRTDLSIAAVGRVEAPAAIEGAVDARQQAFQRSLGAMLGKSLQADVLSKFADGSFLVKVAGATARMQLPAASQVGAQVALTLVALEPRPTFEIHSQPGTRTFAEAGPELAAKPTQGAPEPGLATARPARAPLADGPPLAAPAGASAPSVGSSAHAAALLGKAPLIPASQLPALDAASIPATLSAAGKILGSVLGTAQADGSAPAMLVGRTPLLAAAPLQPEQLAAALKDAVGKSGLFYESHLAEWAGGKRSVAELGQEPQMLRPPAPQTPEAARAPAQPAASVPDPASAQLISLQLQTQEQARVQWQGQAWPGQALRWEIARDAPERGGAGADGGEPGWNSSVRLRFELLGEIGARVSLSGEQLRIHIDAGDSAVGALLRQHAGALGLALDAAGTPLAGLTIRTTAEDA